MNKIQQINTIFQYLFGIRAEDKATVVIYENRERKLLAQAVKNFELKKRGVR